MFGGMVADRRISKAWTPPSERASSSNRPANSSNPDAPSTIVSAVYGAEEIDEEATLAKRSAPNKTAGNGSDERMPVY